MIRINMPKKLNMEWLLSQARDEETRGWLSQIHKWRDHVLERNEFIEDDTGFFLHLDGLNLFFQASSSFSAIEVYEEIFSEKKHFLAPGFEGDDVQVVVDVGANQGFYTLKLKQKNPDCKVVLVEPNPYEFAVLSKNMKENHISNVHLVPKALAASEKVTIEVVPQMGAITGKLVTIPQRPWLKEEFIERLELEAITLDALFERFGLESVDILKIDVEGAEGEILQSASVLERVDRVVVEYHSSELRDSVINLLSGNGFSMVLEDYDGRSYYGDLYFRKAGSGRK